MKKLLSLLLTVSFILCLSSHAFSDTSETEYNWSEVQSVVQEVFSENSKFFLIEEIESSFWTPSFYHIADLSEEEIQDNCIGYLLTEDGSSFILLYYMDMPVDSLDAFFAFYRQMATMLRWLLLMEFLPSLCGIQQLTHSLFLFRRRKENCSK